jgi:hypothetical protein
VWKYKGDGGVKVDGQTENIVIASRNFLEYKLWQE